MTILPCTALLYLIFQMSFFTFWIFEVYIESQSLIIRILTSLLWLLLCVVVKTEMVHCLKLLIEFFRFEVNSNLSNYSNEKWSPERFPLIYQQWWAMDDHCIKVYPSLFRATCILTNYPCILWQIGINFKREFLAFEPLYH